MQKPIVKKSNQSANWKFITFSKHQKRTCNMWKLIKKTENESDVNISEMDQKYLDIPQNFSVFEGFLKKKETDQKSLFGSFPCWGISIAPHVNDTSRCFSTSQGQCLKNIQFSLNSEGYTYKLACTRHDFKECMSSFYKLKPREVKSFYSPVLTDEAGHLVLLDCHLLKFTLFL